MTVTHHYSMLSKNQETAKVLALVCGMWYVVCGMLCVLCVCARALCSVRVRECVFVWGAALYASDGGSDVIYNHTTKKS